MAGTLLQGLFNIIDMFWVGRGLGSAALAGVGTAGFAVWAILSLAEMPSVGLTAVASRRWGEGREREAAEAGYQALGLAILLSAVVGALGLATLGPLFDLMNTPSAVTVQGTGYLSVYYACCPVVFAYFVMAAAFRSAGDTRTPLRILVVALAVNAVLDPLLILGLGPFPRLGIQGAAIATIISRAGGCLLGFVILRRRGLMRRSRLRASAIGSIGWIGLPVSAGGVTFSLIYILLTRFTSEFGTAGIAALSVGHKVESLSFLTCLGFGFAAATAVGQNLGAGRPDRALRAGHAALGYAVVVMAFVGVVFFLLPEQIIGLFDRDPEVIAAGASYLRIVAAAQVFMAIELVLEIAMEGAGYTLVPMLTGVTLTGLRLPLAWWLRTPLGLAGIWWTIALTGIARGVAMAFIWRRGKWRDRAV